MGADLGVVFMRIKLTIILIALNVITFGFLYWLDRQSQLAEMPSESKNYLLGNSLMDSVSILIEGRNLPERRLIQKIQTQWHLKEPMNWPANFYAVQRILTQLQYLSAEASFSLEEMKKTGHTLEDYGLADPALKLTLDNGSWQETLFFGNETALGNSIYVLGPKRDKVYILDKELYKTLMVDCEDLKNPEIFNIPIFELSALTVKKSYPANLNMRLLKKGDSWYFEAPIQTSANSTLVNSAIANLTNIKAEQFLDIKKENAMEMGLENPKMRITLQGNHRSQTLLLGNLASNNPKQYYAQIENIATYFIVNGMPFETLEDAQEELRDKFFLKFQTENLQGITLKQGEKTVQLKKLENGSWQLMNYDKGGNLMPRVADKERVSQLISCFQTLEAVAFVSDAPSEADLEKYGFNNPQRQVNLQGENNTGLIIGGSNPETQRLYAKAENSPFVYEIDSYILAETPVSSLKYENRILSQIPEVAQIRLIRLSDVKNNETLFEYELAADQSWDDVAGNYNAMQSDSIASVLKGIQTFSVRSYLPESFNKTDVGDDATRLPWAYKLEASITLPAGETAQIKNVEYFFTNRLGGQAQIGGCPQSDRTFMLSQQWIDALYTLTEQSITAKAETK